jgi:hypothetical protein
LGSLGVLLFFCLGLFLASFFSASVVFIQSFFNLRERIFFLSKSHSRHPVGRKVDFGGLGYAKLS